MVFVICGCCFSLH